MDAQQTARYRHNTGNDITPTDAYDDVDESTEDGTGARGGGKFNATTHDIPKKSGKKSEPVTREEYAAAKTRRRKLAKVKREKLEKGKR